MCWTGYTSRAQSTISGRAEGLYTDTWQRDDSIGRSTESHRCGLQRTRGDGWDNCRAHDADHVKIIISPESHVYIMEWDRERHGSRRLGDDPDQCQFPRTEVLRSSSVEIPMPDKVQSPEPLSAELDDTPACNMRHQLRWFRSIWNNPPVEPQPHFQTKDTMPSHIASSSKATHSSTSFTSDPTHPSFIDIVYHYGLSGHPSFSSS
jgi:hypothetical protein